MNKKDFVINITAFTIDGGYCCDLNDKIVCCFPIFKQMEKAKLYDSKRKKYK